MNQIYNERIRLLATLLSNVAVGTFVTAIIVPALACYTARLAHLPLGLGGL